MPPNRPSMRNPRVYVNLAVLRWLVNRPLALGRTTFPSEGIRQATFHRWFGHPRGLGIPPQQIRQSPGIRRGTACRAPASRSGADSVRRGEAPFVPRSPAARRSSRPGGPGLAARTGCETACFAPTYQYDETSQAPRCVRVAARTHVTPTACPLHRITTPPESAGARHAVPLPHDQEPIVFVGAKHRTGVLRPSTGLTAPAARRSAPRGSGSARGRMSGPHDRSRSSCRCEAPCSRTHPG